MRKEAFNTGADFVPFSVLYLSEKRVSPLNVREQIEHCGNNIA